MDWPRTIQVFLAILGTQCSNHLVRCKITDVRLVGGPSSHKGTVELRQDNGTWETTCGENLAIGDVILICRQLGFTGASRAIPCTPYGQNSNPTKGLQCNDGVDDLSECTVFSSISCFAAGAASCHGEEYLGCFVDKMNNRVLPVDILVDDPSMSIAKCIQLCNESTTPEYTYAGVEDGDECYCGEANDTYARYGVVSDTLCHNQCPADSTESCGGSGHIAVFTISVVTSTTVTSPITSLANVQSSWASGFSSTDQVEITSTGSKPAISTPSVMSTTPQAPPALPQNGNATSLYAGIGGGVVAFIIIVIIIVIIFAISKRSRKRQKDTSSQGMAFTTPSRPLRFNSHGVINPAMEETSAAGASPRGYHAPDNSAASTPAPRGDKSGLEVNLHPQKSMNVYGEISDNVQGDELVPYASVGNVGTMDARTVPNKNDRLSVVYAMPDKNENATRNVTSEDFGSLYAMPDKSRGEPDGYDEGSSQGLYAMPDKSFSGHKYETDMVENELYSM